MSVRRRQWVSPMGEPKEAWIVDYRDQHGDRHIKTFAKKRDADAHHAIVGVAVRAGTHTADSKSVTVAKAAELWLASCDAAGLERTTLAAYLQHVELRIVPILGGLRLSQLTVPLVRGFEDRLAADGCSPVMVRKCRRLLGSLVGDAQERGLVAQNVVRSLRTSRRGQSARIERRRNGKLKVGVDIPAPDEMRAIVAALPTIEQAARWRPLLLTAIFTGLRASELRGLKWGDVDLKRNEIHVRQRADRYGKIGRTKSEAGERTVPLLPMVVERVARASPRLRERVAWTSPSPTAGQHRASQHHRRARLASGADRRRRGRAARTVSRSPNIPACTRLRHFYASGASTGASTAGWNCRSRSCRRGSATPRSR